MQFALAGNGPSPLDVGPKELKTSVETLIWMVREMPDEARSSQTQGHAGWGIRTRRGFVDARGDRCWCIIRSGDSRAPVRILLAVSRGPRNFSVSP